ncbi:hypothetical protein QYE76_042463 [Lolium multiflorum]|uniref:RNase H type-1 domain-containing protein n=1 Tax=Lolium multiflorum TaxID=4521 RepID=A0AAD8WUY6_LOLMU|nr:hypothetical protein QYE76_042463 [Lolium multiflorum]
MPGVPRELAEHHLVRPEAKPVKQPLRRFAEERRKAIGEEIASGIGPIMEVLHPTENKELRFGHLVNRLVPENLHNNVRVVSACPGWRSLASRQGAAAQRPVYYLSEVLSQSKQNYPHYQKVTYGVYMAAKKLKHYFQEHPIKVVTTAPLAEIIGSKDVNGRVAKWALELAAHSIRYKPRTAIKSQILADFFVDWAEMQYLPPVPDSTHWKLHFDGSKMRTGLGAGVVITSPKGDMLDYVLQIHFAASNNVAEYEALIHGLKVAKEIKVHCILLASATRLSRAKKVGDRDVEGYPTWHRTASTSSS